MRQWLMGPIKPPVSRFYVLVVMVLSIVFGIDTALIFHWCQP